MKVIQGSILCIFLICLLSATTVQASEVWYEWKTDLSSQFVSRYNKQFFVNKEPTNTGKFISESNIRYFVKDGWLGLGYENEKWCDILYNQHAAKFIYQLLNQKGIAEQIDSIDCLYTTYTRENFLIDLMIPFNNWEFQGGYHLIQGSNIFQFMVYDGIARNSQTATLGYEFRSYSKIWQGYQGDPAEGSGYHFSIRYHPTDTVTITLSGDDLASQIIWRNVDEYHGIVDLDFVKTTLDGGEYIKTPLRGDYYNRDSILITPLAPKWRGEVWYQPEDYQIESWAQYQKMWELGLKGSLQVYGQVDCTLGIMYRNSTLVYLLGAGNSNIQIDLALNSVSRKELTNFAFNIKTHLF